MGYCNLFIALISLSKDINSLKIIQGTTFDLHDQDFGTVTNATKPKQD